MQRSLSAAFIALLLVLGLVAPASAQQAPPGPPQNPEVLFVDNEIQLRWDPPTDGVVSLYRIEQSPNEEDWSPVGETTSTTFTVTPAPGVRFFRIRAEGPGGPSAWVTVPLPAINRANILHWIRDMDWSRYAEDVPRFLATADDSSGALRTRRQMRREISRASSGTNQWYDTCNDVTQRPANWAAEGPTLQGWEQHGGRVAGARLDLRSTMLVRAGDQLGFLGYSCRPWTTPDLGGGSMVWAVYSHPGEDIPTHLVVVFQHRGDLLGLVLRVMSPNPADWFTTWITRAERLDEHAVDVVVPDKALGQVGSFQFEWAVVDGAGREDLFPERYVPRISTQVRQPTAEALFAEVSPFAPHSGIPAFPNPCTPGSAYTGQIDWVWGSYVPAGHPDNRWAAAATRLPNDQPLTSGAHLAVLDDGVSPRLGPGRVGAGFDAAFRQSLPAGVDSDRGGHGTAAAGLAAAAPATGMTGVNAGVPVVPIRVVDSNQCTNQDALALGVWDAIDLAHDAAGLPRPSAPPQRDFGSTPVRLPPWTILIPLSGPAPGNAPGRLGDAINAAQALGITVVTAAGNTGQQVGYPAGLNGVIAVGSTTRGGGIADYSPSHRKIDVVAPGGEGTGTSDRDVVSFWEHGRFRPQFGTGVSAALVAGAVAGYRGQWPQASPGGVRAALQASARDRGAPGHDPDFGFGELDVAGFIGTPPGIDPATGQLPRVSETQPAELAVAVSRQRFPQGGARHAVLARHDLFADALAGAPLTAQGPLLLSGQSRLPEVTEPELRRVLGAGGKVYILGGHEAIGPEVEAHVAALGFSPHRLAGATRIDTALAVAEEVRALYPGRATVALARAFGKTPDDTAAWADAVSGGAWAAATRTPVLVTGSDRLDPQVAARLQGWGIQRTVLFGGGAALSAAVEQAVPGPMRIAGPDRAATAAAVAGSLWSEPRQVLVFNGYIRSGWAFGLAAAGWAADRNAPLVMVDHQILPDATRTRVASLCPGSAGVTLIGSDQVIGGSVEAGLAGAAAC
jgi:putative cell wall-binding protein